ncbi:hypothetical protein BD779DRAFT_1473620 [Infundibulicybe gibba]|nr:hypothetical protein BD779DRAFT_1473620 [Infundibulicybe gibba]
MSDINHSEGVQIFHCAVIANSVKEYDDMPGLDPPFGGEAEPPDEGEFEDMPELEMADAGTGDETGPHNAAIGYYVQAYLSRHRCPMSHNDVPLRSYRQPTLPMCCNTHHPGDTLMFPDLDALMGNKM